MLCFSRVNSSFGFAFISRTFDLKMRNPSNTFVRENLLKAVTLSNTSYVVLLFKTNQVCALVVITARKRSLGQGNIFTPVCHSVHRGVVCVVAGGWACVRCWGDVCGWGACVVAGGVVRRIRRDTVNERAVCILLECILVSKRFDNLHGRM